jgi:hypothetical protein
MSALLTAVGREHIVVDRRDRLGRGWQDRWDEFGSRIDSELRAAGCEAMSISKYRLGVGLLLADDPTARTPPH